MIAQDMTNAEIAGTLVLSNHTIKTHINRIFAKTGSANRAEASRFARAHGLIEAVCTRRARAAGGPVGAAAGGPVRATAGPVRATAGPVSARAVSSAGGAG